MTDRKINHVDQIIGETKRSYLRRQAITVFLLVTLGNACRLAWLASATWFDAISVAVAIVWAVTLIWTSTFSFAEQRHYSIERFGRKAHE